MTLKSPVAVPQKPRSDSECVVCLFHVAVINHNAFTTLLFKRSCEGKRPHIQESVTRDYVDKLPFFIVKGLVDAALVVMWARLLLHSLQLVTSVNSYDRHQQENIAKDQFVENKGAYFGEVLGESI